MDQDGDRRPMYSKTVRGSRWATISLREMDDGIFALEVAKVDAGDSGPRFEPQTILVRQENLLTIGWMIQCFGQERLGSKEKEEDSKI